jgi:hypothetical protein
MAKAKQLPLCDGGRCPCKRRVTKARNRFYEQDCAQVASRGVNNEPLETLEVSGNSAILTKRQDPNEPPIKIKTLEQLMAVCEVDRNVWTVDKYIVNTWGNEGHFQVKAWLERKVKMIAAREEVEALIAEAKSRLPKRDTLIRNAKHIPSTGYMLELCIPDLHVGKMAWADETGHGHYDSKIAEQRFQTAIDTLLHRASNYRFDQIVLTVGNDLLNSDNIEDTTTAGTPQDTDGRFHKTFGIVRRMITKAIEQLRVIAPVHVVVVPGNHDTLTAWHLGDSLDCYFHADNRVTIDNAPTKRKYHQFGKVMLCFTHGDKVKGEKLVGLMSTERPEMWAATRHREAHTGHTHESKVLEFRGTRIRVSPALCEPDAWHAEMGYVGNHRGAEALVWHKDDGLVSINVFTVTPEAA